MKIKYVSDITKYTSKIKFPIFLHICNSRKQKFNIDDEEKLIAIIIKLYQQNFPIKQLMYEEIEYVEFEEIKTSLIKI